MMRHLNSAVEGILFAEAKLTRLLLYYLFTKRICCMVTINMYRFDKTEEGFFTLYAQPVAARSAAYICENILFIVVI